MEYLPAEDAFDRLDRDRDGKLTYQEAFEGNMLDDMLYRRFDEIYSAIDLDGDEMLTQAEFAAYVARDFKGAKTAAELAAEAQTLFDRYNRSSLEYDGEQVVTKDEAWRIVSEGDYKNEVYKREIARLPYSSHQGFA